MIHQWKVYNQTKDQYFQEKKQFEQDLVKKKMMK